MEYQNYSYQLTANGVHSYDNAQLTVTHKPSGKTKCMIVESALMPPGLGFGRGHVYKLIKELEDEM